MINNLKIADIASYNYIGVEIAELKINFFYGANGCGKTTISNYLANPSDSKFQSCLTSWSGDNSLKRLVYNRQFRNANFATDRIAGVFTLGQATTEEISESRPNTPKAQI